MGMMHKMIVDSQKKYIYLDYWEKKLLYVLMTHIGSNFKMREENKDTSFLVHLTTEQYKQRNTTWARLDDVSLTCDV